MTVFKVCRFYGWALKEIDEMTYSDFTNSIVAMRQIEAQETLLGFSVSSHPHLKEEDRKKRHKSVYTDAFPIDNEKSQVVSMAEYAKLLSQGKG